MVKAKSYFHFMALKQLTSWKSTSRPIQDLTGQVFFGLGSNLSDDRFIDTE